MSDAKKLHNFYDSEQGKIFSWFLRREIFRRWDIFEEDKAAALGFTSPYRKLFGKKNFISLSNEPIANSVHISEAQLPFRNAELKRVFAIHYLENVHIPFLALQEIWRALEPNGSFLLVVPNKKSLWKNSDIAGKESFSEKDMREMLIANKFYIREVSQAVFYPPWMTSEYTKLFKYFPFFGAVTIFHTQKIIFPNRGRPIRISTSLREWALTKKKTANV